MNSSVKNFKNLRILLSSIFFDEKINQGISKEKYKQLRDMPVSNQFYASKIRRKRMAFEFV